MLLILYFEQQGLCPLNTREYSKSPFLSGDKIDHGSKKMESFYLTVGFLRCFDAAANTEDKKIYFNLLDRDNRFSSGARKAPPYTEFFRTRFFKVAANLDDISKEILEASSPEANEGSGGRGQQDLHQGYQDDQYSNQSDGRQHLLPVTCQYTATRAP
jgi:hypothetical protein